MPTGLQKRVQKTAGPEIGATMVLHTWGRRSRIIRASIASYRPEDCRPAARPGSRPSARFLLAGAGAVPLLPTPGSPPARAADALEMVCPSILGVPSFAVKTAPSTEFAHIKKARQEILEG